MVAIEMAILNEKNPIKLQLEVVVILVDQYEHLSLCQEGNECTTSKDKLRAYYPNIYTLPEAVLGGCCLYCHGIELYTIGLWPC